jgi:hypothetical protein
MVLSSLQYMHRTDHQYLGVPVREKNFMFGDSKSLVDSSMEHHAKLHKRHTMLSFHCVREAIASDSRILFYPRRASGILGFYFIPGESCRNLWQALGIHTS